jgi:hypothetical protein
MPKVIKYMLCKILGHKWTKVSEIDITTGPRGRGAMVWEECSRCKETKIRWIADLNFGVLKKKAPKKTPKLSNDVIDKVDEGLLNDTDVGTKTNRAKNTATSAA